MEIFYDRVIELAKTQHITQYQLSVAIGISDSSIGNWKNKGTIPSGEICYKIAKYFNVNTEWLISGIGPKRSYKEKDSYDMRISQLSTAKQKLLDTILVALEESEI